MLRLMYFKQQMDNNNNSTIIYQRLKDDGIEEFKFTEPITAEEVVEMLERFQNHHERYGSPPPGAIIPKDTYRVVS